MRQQVNAAEFIRNRRMFASYFRLSMLASISLLNLVLPYAALAQAPQVYSMTPNPAPMNTAFTIYLTGGRFACGSTFSRESAIVTGNRIDLTFEAVSPVFVPGTPGVTPTTIPPICVYDQADITPVETLTTTYFLPRFKLPALPSGEYEVWITQVYACQFTQPPCLVASQVLPLGTLLVTQSSTVLISSRRTGVLTASWEGAAVVFDLPEARVAGATDAPSAWSAELLSLRGERLSVGTVRPDAQARGRLALPSRPSPGIYLLKLRGAAGGVHIMPVYAQVAP